MTPDINVLIAAARADHSHHPVARSWLNGAVEACGRGGTLEILPMVAAGFLRVTTNRKAFREPSTIDDAVAFLTDVLEVPGASMPELGAEWNTFATLCLDRGLRANQIADAWIAAAVSSLGLHLVTLDADFGRLLRPSEYTLLDRGMKIQESPRGYAVRPRFYRPTRARGRHA